MLLGSLARRVAAVSGQHYAHGTVRVASMSSVRMWRGLSTAPGAPAPPSAACVIIGDEVLNGKTLDTNSNVLAQILFQRGVALRRITTIPDDLDTIATEVRKASEEYDHVFTSGGIGPTHDDMTYMGIANAFGLDLEHHEPTVTKLTYHVERNGKQANAARLRMALLPKGNADVPVDVWTMPRAWVPLVVVQNVHILPGVPGIFKAMMEHHAHRFGGDVTFHRSIVASKPGMQEGDFADELGALQSKVKAQGIMLGSYPKRISEREWANYVSIEGPHKDDVAAAAEKIVQLIQGTIVVQDEPTAKPKPKGII